MRKLRMILAKGGDDGHDRALRKILPRPLVEAGLELIYLGNYQSPEQIVWASIQEDADVIGVSVHTGSHNDIFGALISLLSLKSQGRSEAVVCGGGVVYPQDIPALTKMGVKKFFGPETKPQEIVSWLGSLKMSTRVRAIKFLLKKAAVGDELSLARFLSAFEEDGHRVIKVLDDWTRRSFSAVNFRVGVTGPGGTGKSTFIWGLLENMWEDGRIAALLCDPRDSQSGGALLGDRIRMQNLCDGTREKNLFIRSLATQSPGGIHPYLEPMMQTLALCSYKTVIVESVGVGQQEDILSKLVDVLIAVVPPDAGDALNLLKANYLKRAQIIVVNKSDDPKALSTFNLVKSLFTETPVFLVNSFMKNSIAPVAEFLREVKRKKEEGCGV